MGRNSSEKMSDNDHAGVRRESTSISDQNRKVHDSGRLTFGASGATSRVDSMAQERLGSSKRLDDGCEDTLASINLL